MRRARDLDGARDGREVCNKCGSRGVPEALLTCTACKLSREHRYCTVTFPTVLEPWICETCLTKKETIQISNKGSPLIRTKQNAKVKFISADEVASLALGSQTPVSGTKGRLWTSVQRASSIMKKASSIPEFMSSRPTAKTEESISEEEPCISLSPCFQPLTMDSGTPHKSSLTINSENPSVTTQPDITVSQLSRADSRSDSQLSSMCTKSHQEMTLTDKDKKGNASSPQRSTKLQTGNTHLEVQQTPIFPQDAEGWDHSKNAGVVEHPATPLANDTKNGTQHVGPDFQESNILSTVSNGDEIQWRGRLMINDMGCIHTYEDIQAYFPCTISPKAYAASKTLPEVLQVRFINRLDIWPKIFQQEPPSSEDVAMYLLPNESCRRKDKYDRLLGRMNNYDLGMRCLLDEYELLIYTSKFLSLGLQELDTRVCLWGIFRHRRVKKQDRKTGFAGEGTCTEAKLQIDMPRGIDDEKANKPVISPGMKDHLDVHVIDSIKLQKSHEKKNFLSVPPGFTKLGKEDWNCGKKLLVKHVTNTSDDHTTADVSSPSNRTLNLKHTSGWESSQGIIGEKSTHQVNDKENVASCETRGEDMLKHSSAGIVNSMCHQAPLVADKSKSRVVTSCGGTTRPACPAESITLQSHGCDIPEPPPKMKSVHSFYRKSRTGESRHTNEGEIPVRGINRPVPLASAELSLSSRPRHVNDQNRSIPSASSQRPRKVEHGKDVRLPP